MPKTKDKKGFIAIIALGIFALLAVFGIIVQMTVVNTYASVKDTNSYYQAKDIADSLTEYMQNEVKNHYAGYATGIINCLYTAGVPAVNNPAACTSLNPMVGTHNVNIKFEIKGRPTNAENINTGKCGSGLNSFNASCYLMPLGDGDAGTRCDLYKPFPPPNGAFVDANITGGFAAIDNADYSCNWNKLTFGSSLTDRVTIPLYFDDGTGNNVVSAFNTATPANQKANKFILRLRTPCKPYSQLVNGAQPLDTRAPVAGGDETVCDDLNGRYVLDTSLAGGGDDFIVQWQLSGTCTINNKEQECGLVSSAQYNASIIKESDVNNIFKIDLSRNGLDTSSHPQIGKQLSQLIPNFKSTNFTLFLSHSLISTNGNNVPYLEYQLQTDKPVGNAKIKMDVINVSVDGSNFSESLYQGESKPLIDFAIQN